MDKEQRVYIGNRYVPLIMGKWDINQEYESLSIVVDSKNNSYTSKTNVPVGIELLNEKYWVMTGAYEGVMLEIEKKLSARIDECKESIQTLKDLHVKDVSEIQIKIDKLESDIKELGQKIIQSDLNQSQAIASINEKVAKIELDTIKNVKELSERVTSETERINVEIEKTKSDIVSLKDSVSNLKPKGKTKSEVDITGNPKITMALDGDGIYIVDLMIKLSSNKGLTLTRQKLVVLDGTHSFGEKGVPLTHGTEYAKITASSVSFLKNELVCEATISPVESSKITVVIEKIMEV